MAAPSRHDMNQHAGIQQHRFVRRPQVVEPEIGETDLGCPRGEILRLRTV